MNAFPLNTSLLDVSPLNTSSMNVESHSHTNASHLEDAEFDDFLRSIGKHPQQIIQDIEVRKNSHLVDCVVCAQHHGTISDSGLEQIQCGTCFIWSHTSCIKEQFELDDETILNGEITWICPGRCDKSIPLWTEDLYVFYYFALGILYAETFVLELETISFAQQHVVEKPRRRSTLRRFLVVMD